MKYLVNSFGLTKPLGTAMAVLLCCMLGCGGGGGGGQAKESYSIKLNQTSLAFSADNDGPAPFPQRVAISYKGDGLIVGYPPGVNPPSWIIVNLHGISNSTAELQVQPYYASLAPGTYTTTLRVVTGKADGSEYVYSDLPISYTIYPGLTPSTTLISFDAPEGQSPMGQSFTLQSGRPNFSWRVEASSTDGSPLDWLALPRTADHIDGISDIVNININPKPTGTYSARLALYDDKNTARGTIVVTYHSQPIYNINISNYFSLTEASQSSALLGSGALNRTPNAPETASPAWQITCDQPWLAISPSSGSLAMSTPLTLSLDAARIWKLPNGVHNASVLIQFPGSQVKSTVVPITLDLSLSPTLTVEAPHIFLIDQTTKPADLSQQVRIGTNLGTAFSGVFAWHATSNAPWLNPTSEGDSQTRNKLTLNIPPESIANLETATNWARVAILSDDPRLASTSVDVEVVQTLPAVEHVAPQCTWVGRYEDVVLRGTGFSGLTVPVQIGSNLVDGSIVSPTEVHVRIPPQESPGPLSVSVPNFLGIPRKTGTVAVVASPTYGAAEIPLAGNFLGMALDPERNAVMVVTTDLLTRYRWTGTEWSSDLVPIPNAQAAMVDTDGKSILVTSSNSPSPVTVLALDPATLALQNSWISNDYFHSFSDIAIFNDATGVLHDWEAGSISWLPSFVGPVDSGNRYTTLAEPRNRNRIVLAGQRGGIANRVCVMPVGESSFQQILLERSFDPRALAVNGDGSRMFLGGQVRDGDGMPLGAVTIPETIIDLSAMAPDGKTLFTASRDFSNNPFLRRTDISAAQGPYSTDPDPIQLPPPPPLMRREFWKLTVSEDGSTLFLICLLVAPDSNVTWSLHVLPQGTPNPTQAK